MNSQSTGNSPGPICCSGKRRRRGPWAVVVVCLVALSPAMGAAADPAGGEAWEALPSHGADADPVVPRRLRDEISRASASAAGRGGMAARLADVLEAPDLTPEAALFVCRELARVGDDTSLPALVPWLRSGDTRRVDLARTALEGIGTAAARQALREALPHSEGNARLGIVRSIGVLRDVQAVPALDGMREAADPVLQEAVLLALAEIGTPAAAAAVRRAGPPAAADRARTDALLLAAQRLFAGGHGEAAGEICAELWEAPLDRRDRAAALQGMARSRHPATAAALRQAIDDRNATLAGTAAGLLRIVDMPEVLAGIVADLDALTPVAQTRVLEVLGERGAREYAGAAAEWLSAADEGVRGAAIRALGAIGAAAQVTPLARSGAAGPLATRREVLASLTSMAAEGCDAAILAGAATAADADVRALLLEAATARRSPGLPAMLRDAVDDPAAAVRVAAWRGLAEFATAAAYADAVQRLLLRPEADQAVRQAHENALVRMAARLSAQEEDGAGSVAPLAALWQGDAPVSVRVAVLRLAGRLGGDSALGLVRQGLAAADADLRREALRALAAWPDDGAVEDLLALLAGKEDAAAHTLAARGLARQVEQDLPAPEEQLRVLDALAALAEDASLGAWARRRREAVVSGSTAELALVAVPRRSARRRQELAEGVPEGFRLVAYLDCGPEAVDGKAPAPCLRVVRGAPYLWAGAEKNGPVQAATVIFDGSLVSVEASGLDPGKTYRVGMTWWDYDAHGRVQTVVAGGTALLSRVRLPNHARDRQPAAEAMVELPAGVYGKGVVRVDVLRAGPVNAVLSEVWLLESDAPPERAAGTAPFPGAKRVLLLTGEDYKGHAWQATAPVLAAELRQDRRFVVDVVDDLTRLRTLALDDYAAVVLHFKNYDAAVPGREAFDRLAAFVRAGGGLVLVHFAGGAFEEFRADFAPLAGRVWNPALRGHDPYGAFRVRIAPVAHPITAGLADFETTDELYTCLEGDLPVTVLADAVSRVDGKDYPMAFVFPCGQGRVFHCPLGHDPGALAHPTVAELFRRGTAWCAGLDPVASAPPARTSSGADVLRRVLFVAGPDSHGEGTHDHEAGCRLLAAELERCVAGMAADVSLGWPQDGRLLAGADALVVYSDGEEGHPILGHIEDVAARVKQGMGVVCLHYALAVPGETAGAAFLEWLGGYYETWWSVNPVWEAHFEALPEHLVTRGVRPFALRDEWYYHMRFRQGMEGVVPVLSAVPPDATRRGPDGPHSGNPQVRARMGRAEHVAWAYEGRDGARGFGFTGGHWHANWQHPDVLRLVLNAIVWAARGEVPPGGTGGESAAQPPSR